MSRIESLLGEYDARKRNQRDAQAKVAAAEQECRERGERLLEAVAAPVLNSIADEIRAAGHHCEVKRHRGCYAGLSLEFQPKSEIANLFTSQLFLLAEADRLKVSQSVRLVGDRQETTSEKRWPLADVSEAKVRAEAESFIAGVLAAN